MDRRTFIQVTPAALAALAVADCSLAGTGGGGSTPINIEQTITAIADWVQAKVSDTCKFIPNLQTILEVVKADFPNILVSGSATIAETALAAVVATICQAKTAPATPGPALHVMSKAGNKIEVHGYAWDEKQAKFVTF